MSASATSIYSALWQHPVRQAAMEFRAALLTHSRHAIDFREFDGHPANHKLNALPLQEGRRTATLAARMTCRSHANQLVVVSCLSACGMHIGKPLCLVNDMYASSLFLRTP